MSRVRRLGAADGRAFTLVETVMALGIAMLFLAAIFTLLSVGLTTSKDASDDTVIGLILRDVANRIRGEKMNASAPPPEWKLTASNARHLPRSHPQSRAFREYVREPAAGQNPSESETSGTVRITVVDIGSNRELAEVFREGSLTEKATRLTISGMPAIRTDRPDETEHLDVLAHNRFLITVALIGPASGKAEEWVKRINLDGLRQIAAQENRFDPRRDLEFLVERVDELNPSRTRTARYSIAGDPDPTPSN